MFFFLFFLLQVKWNKKYIKRTFNRFLKKYKNIFFQNCSYSFYIMYIIANDICQSFQIHLHIIFGAIQFWKRITVLLFLFLYNILTLFSSCVFSAWRCSHQTTSTWKQWPMFNSVRKLAHFAAWLLFSVCYYWTCKPKSLAKSWEIVCVISYVKQPEILKCVLCFSYWHRCASHLLSVPLCCSLLCFTSAFRSPFWTWVLHKPSARCMPWSLCSVELNICSTDF